MRYSSLTKAELVSVIEVMEKDYLDALELVETYKAKSVDGYVEAFKKEAVLFWEDLNKLGHFIYDLGVSAQQQLSTVLKTNN